MQLQTVTKVAVTVKTVPVDTAPSKLIDIVQAFKNESKLLQSNTTSDNERRTRFRLSDRPGDMLIVFVWGLSTAAEQP